MTFEIQMIKCALFSVCLSNHYGPSCAICRKCQSCDPITGRCTQCPPSFYGEECQYRCPHHCLNMTCDQTTGRCTQCPPSFYGEECQYSCPQHCLDLICDKTTGICNGCQNGHTGQRCELEITTVVSTGKNFVFERSTIPQIHSLICFPYLYICPI